MEQDEKAKAVANQRRAAATSDTLGPGTSGHTIAGAAYRGMEVAARTGAPSPEERGFSNNPKPGNKNEP
ncbi:MAG: hypothetical protein ACK4K6_17945 [Pseudarthrobacter sp.]